MAAIFIVGLLGLKIMHDRTVVDDDIVVGRMIEYADDEALIEWKKDKSRTIESVHRIPRRLT